jgi:hypothetical protein
VLHPSDLGTRNVLDTNLLDFLKSSTFIEQLVQSINQGSGWTPTVGRDPPLIAVKHAYRPPPINPPPSVGEMSPHYYLNRDLCENKSVI